MLTAPQVNAMDSQRDHYEKCITGHLNFRQSQKNNVTDIVWAEEIHEKDLFMCFDGNKTGNNNTMSKAFTGMSESGQKVALPASKPKRLNITYDFDTVVLRRSRQKEVVMAMNHKASSSTPRRNFSGTL